MTLGQGQESHEQTFFPLGLPLGHHLSELIF